MFTSVKYYHKWSGCNAIQNLLKLGEVNIQPHVWFGAGSLLCKGNWQSELMNDSTVAGVNTTHKLMSY